MADRTSTESRRQRSAARDRRRSLASKPFEELDEAARGDDAADGGGEGDSRTRSTLKQAAVTALAGAVAAGLGGAARALVDRRSEEGGGEDAGAAEEPEDLPEQGASASTPDDEQSEEPEGEDDAAEAEEPTSGPQAEASEPEDDASDDDQEQREEPEREERAAGVSASDAKAIVDQARAELEELLSAEVESISGLQQRDGHWTVTAEVVQVHRIPESTDVLASYQVELDDDRNLVGINEVRRYRRSQVEEGS